MEGMDTGKEHEGVRQGEDDHFWAWKPHFPTATEAMHTMTSDALLLRLPAGLRLDAVCGQESVCSTWTSSGSRQQLPSPSRPCAF